ncbi:MBL fold metallo-hydrolase [Nocardia asiatica]|uniref:MBL fold metallo-hydrolase n=1 Tax=Nocardia asiatica TaxID=209252 RepID=UPI0002EE5838|nr:MBL fold metallo-hydrolase [Nocardia asiatica]
MTVTFLPDGSTSLKAEEWLPGTETILRTHPEYLDASGSLVASVGGILVEHGSRAILIDCGFGPLQFQTSFGLLSGGALLDSLAAVGRGPGRIEAVALTHLHADHLGWLWQSAPGAAQPPFSAAKVYIGEEEWRHRALAEQQGTAPQMLEVFASQVQPVGDGETIFPGVHALRLPGHTIGHTAYVISDAGQRLIAFGDALQSSLQIAYPEMSTATDYDHSASELSRRRLIAELTEPRTLGFGVHFADVQVGRVVQVAGAYRWQPFHNYGDIDAYV